MTLQAPVAPVISVASLIAEQEETSRRDREKAEHLERKQQEELSAFKKRLDDFELTNDRIEAVIGRIRRAFERGESELMLTSFPSTFCTDGGRAVNNADIPPINKPEPVPPGVTPEPEWLATLPRGARVVYHYWEENLKPGGFQFTARIINYKDGIPGDVGLFLTWPRSLTAQS